MLSRLDHLEVMCKVELGYIDVLSGLLDKIGFLQIYHSQENNLYTKSLKKFNWGLPSDSYNEKFTAMSKKVTLFVTEVQDASNQLARNFESLSERKSSLSKNDKL